MINLLPYVDSHAATLWEAMHDAIELNGDALFGKRHALNLLAAEIISRTNATTSDSHTELNLSEVSPKRGPFSILLNLPLKSSVYDELLRYIAQMTPNNSDFIDEIISVNPKDGQFSLRLDELLVLVKKIPHASYLFSGETEIACQMFDLLEFTPVAQQRYISRDFSYLVPKDYPNESIMRDAIHQLGTDTKYLDELRIVSATDYADLTESARNRLGATPEQKNILLHLKVCSSETETVFSKEYWEAFIKAINLS